jgi:hypothetical protein
MPPTIGAAIRFHTSDPVPVAHMIGINPTNIVATVMNFWRRRFAAPSTIVAWRSASVRDRGFHDGAKYFVFGCMNRNWEEENRLLVLADALLVAVREHADNGGTHTSSGTTNGAR